MVMHSATTTIAKIAGSIPEQDISIAMRVGDDR